MLDAMSKAAAAALKAKTFLFMIASKLRFNPRCVDLHRQSFRAQ